MNRLKIFLILMTGLVLGFVCSVAFLYRQGKITQNIIDVNIVKRILLRYENAIIEIAKDDAGAEIGVLVEGEVVFGFSLTKDSDVKMIRRRLEDSGGDFYVIDQDGDGFADFEVLMDFTSGDVKKTKIKFSKNE